MKVTLKNLDEVNEYLKNLPEKSFNQAKEVFQDAVLDAANKVKDNATSILKVRSGALRRSIQQSVTGSSLKNLKASVYSDAGGGQNPVVYAPVHELGATITAKKAYARMPGGPFLNIPTANNQHPTGVMKFTAKDVFRMGGHIRGRSVWLGNQMMFALKKSVTIQPRLGMIKACEDEIPTILSGLDALLGT